MEQQISLYSSEWYDVEAPLIFFIGNKVRAQNLDAVQDVIEKLVGAQTLVIGRYKELEDTYSFIILLDRYILQCMRSGQNNMVITYISDLAAMKKYRLKESIYNKTILNLVPREGIMVCLQSMDAYGEKEYTIYPEELADLSWDMDEDVLAGVDVKMKNHFEASLTEPEDSKFSIGFRFRKQILDKIRDYTYYEDENEKYQALQGSSLVYTRRVSTTNSSRLSNYTYQFYCPVFDEESFHLGTRVSLESSILKGSGDYELLDGVVVDIILGDEETIVEISFSRQFNDADLPQAGKVSLQHNPVQRRVREKVLSAIEKSEIRSTYMYKTFNSYQTEGYELGSGWEEFEYELDHPKDGFKPNDSQKEAIRKGIQTKDLQLVLGPPGTGKTTVIVAWIEYFVRQGMRVLVSSQNNMAVDNVLARVARMPSVGILRIGNENKVQDNVKAFLPEKQDQLLYESYRKTFEQDWIQFQNDLERLQSLAGLIQTAEAYLAEYQDADDTLKQRYVDIASQMRAQKECRARILLLEAELNEKIEAMARKDIYLRDTARSSMITKALRFLYTIGIKRELAKLEGAFAEETQEYRKQVELYNRGMVDIRNAVNDHEIAHRKTRYKELAETLAPYLQMRMEFESPYEPIECSIDLDNSRQSRERLETFKAQCERARVNIEKAQAALREWELALKDKRNEIMTSILIQRADVVGATCIGINSNRKFADVDFDIAIIDEAGQIQIHNIIVPMTRARKNLLLGDYLQIPPIVNDKVAKLCKADGVSTDLLEMSFFEYLFRNPSLPEENKARLKWQFRMPGEIADIISHQFYEDEYFSIEKKRSMASLCRDMFARPLVILDTSDEDQRRETPHKEGGFFNEYEARIILQILAKIFDGGEGTPIKPKDIGIIAPYSKQVQLIRRVLKSRLSQLSADEIDEMAATLDSFQGQERKLIIYSSTRSNTEPPEAPRIGFMKELRRLNVAFTRCQEQLVIIGDMDFLSSCEYEERTDEGELVPNKSEKEFSQFISDLGEQVEAGAGEWISSREFLKQRNGEQHGRSE